MRQKLAELVDLIYGFRKFIAFLLLFLTGVIFRLTNQIDGGQFVDLQKNVGLAFFAANGIEHFTAMAKDYIASKAAPAATDTPPKEDT